MNILSVNKYHRSKGGSETIFLGEMALLREVGHGVVPFCMEEPESLPSEYQSFFVNNVDYEKPGLANKIIASSKVLYSFDARQKISALLEAKDVDVAHLHLFQHQISPSIFAPLRKRGIPIVATLHDLKPICGNYKMYVKGAICERCKGGKHYHLLKNRCNKGSFSGSLVNTVEMYLHKWAGFYDQIDMFIAVSKFYRDKMIEFGFPEEKLAYLPSFVSAREVVTCEREPYVLYFGRLSEEKGVDLFIEAAAKSPATVHRIAGTGPEEASLKQQVNALGLSNVRFEGFQTGEALRALIGGALAVVVPSRWYENSPLTVLEAFEQARPVIGADIGGIPELIEEQVDGLIFEAGNAIDLAKKIAWITNDTPAAAAMGLRGREKVVRRFGPERHLSDLLAIYRSVGVVAP